MKVILFTLLCVTLASCQSSRVPMVQTTTTSKSLAGGDVTTTTQTPYETPWDQAAADALRNLFTP